MSKSDEIAIKVSHVSKSFKLPHEKNTSVKSYVVNPFKKRTFEKQQVLNGINFEIKKGEFFGIVGRNGSGKSTLLKLLAGIYSPDSGHIQVNGKLTPFIELGVGFNFELTGRENVFLNGALLGFSRKEMMAMYDDIVEFAELEKFMDQKLKNYSSGMQVRLAFSIAIRAQSDILLLDEVLAVGDYNFQKKCFDYFTKLKRNKKTVVFVSHDMSSMSRYCDRVLYLNAGSIKTLGKTDHVVNEYTMDQITKAAKDEQEASSATKNSTKINTQKKISIKKVFLTDKKLIHKENDKIKISVVVEANDKIADPIVGIIIKNNTGDRVFESNTLWKKIDIGSLTRGDTVTCDWVLDNVLTTGDYLVDVAIASDSGHTFHDMSQDNITIRVQKPYPTAGIVDFKHALEVNRN